MSQSIEALVIEDSAEDTFLLMRELSKHIPGINHTRVDTLASLNEELKKKWDVILCDFNLPEFDGLTALHLIREKGIETPFILVSGMVEESIAASMMRLGANDYIMKDNLKRLGPAVIRELEEAKLRLELRSTAKKAEQERPTGDKAGTDVGTEPKVPVVETEQDGKQNEILFFIENTRKLAGQGKFIQERHKAVVNILYVAGLIKKHQDKILEREGLTDQQFNLLRILMRHHPHRASINQLREEILTKTTDVSRLIERMVTLGMIHYEKNEEDRRFRFISISEKGLQLLENMNRCADEMFFTSNEIPEEDARIINEKLKKMLGVMEE